MIRWIIRIAWMAWIERMDGWMDEWMDRRKEGRKGGRKDVRTVGWMERRPEDAASND